MQYCARLTWLAILLLLVAVSAYAQGPLQFVSATPCRVVDTRNPDGPFGGPSIQGGAFRSFTLPGSPSCNIPSSAVAYSVNVTVVPQGPLGYLTVWPTGQTQPVVSTTNSLEGLIKANAAIVPAGTSGAISVFASNTTDVVLDIDGYFIPATDSALAFYPVTPCRVADTRNGQPLTGGVPRNFSIQGVCGVPTAAEAYSLNFTAVPHGNPLGYLTVWPAGETQPVVSTLNAPTGTTTANAAIVPGGTSGKISAFASNTTDLVIDINGYFAPPGSSGELSLYTLPPCRVLDTRSTRGQFTGELTVDVVGSACNVPAGAGAYVLNATVVPPGALGYLTLWPNGGTQPVVSTLNALDGQVTSNMAIVPTTNGSIDAFASNPTQLVVDIFSYLAPIVRITTTSLPNGEVNRAYPQTQLMATGGVPPYTWTVISGNFPSGLSLSTAGVISGTPTVSGTFDFTVQVKDTQNHTSSAPLTITITAPLTITTTTLPGGQVNLPYDATLAATGGAPPYSWSISSGHLPGGLTLNSSTGEISGTPSGAGTSNFTAKVEDSQMQTATAPLSITITAVGNATLNGTYAFSFSGYKSGGPVIMAGSFIADGAGHITSGVVDYNDGSGEFNDPSQCRDNPNCPIPLTIVAAPSSVYSLGANGLGTITIVATDHNGNQNTFQFAVAVAANACVVNAHHPTCGRLIQSDPAHPQDYGSGVLKVQDPNSFSSFFPGNFAMQITGTDRSGNRYAGAGALATNPTTLVDIDCNNNGWHQSGCPLDINDNGSPASDPISGGQFSSDLNSTTGRGTFVNLKFPDDPSLCAGGISDCGYAYYIVNPQELIMISSDPISRPANLTLWTGLRQQSTSRWSVASLNGASVLELSAEGPDVTVGLFAANGSGSATLNSDENQSGTLKLQQSSSGTYALDSNGEKTGRVTTSGFSAQFGSTPPVLYLVGNNYAFAVGTDAKVSSGVLEPQSGAPFSNASVSGVYAGGSIAPVLAAVTNSVTSMFADAGGNIAATQDTSGPNGPGGPTNLTLTYSVDQTGRAVVNQNGNQYGILYVVSPTKVVLMPVGNNPALSVFASAPTD